MARAPGERVANRRSSSHGAAKRIGSADGLRIGSDNGFSGLSAEASRRERLAAVIRDWAGGRGEFRGTGSALVAEWSRVSPRHSAGCWLKGLAWPIPFAVTDGPSDRSPDFRWVRRRGRGYSGKWRPSLGKLRRFVVHRFHGEFWRSLHAGVLHRVTRSKGCWVWEFPRGRFLLRGSNGPP